MRERARTIEWEIKQSSLAKISKHEPTYEECRNYACKDIISQLTHIKKQDIPFVIEIPENTDFHFIGRVNTTEGKDIAELCYDAFKQREFVAFSTINRKNISHYKGRTFFIYDLLPEDIVHIFPADSDTKKYAEDEDDLTFLPSLWLTLKELDKITEMLGVYNQITGKTKRNGKIIKPLAVVAFDNLDEKIKKIAMEFKIGCVIIHPDKDAINYDQDLIYDEYKFDIVSRKIDTIYGIDMKEVLYLD